jgi:N-acetylmuramoyl-L-alanine amidase
MIAFAYYLLKVIICSGVLFLYYHVALRNKLFHQWNRFYLLASVFISLVAPIVQVSIMHQVSDEPNKGIQMLQVFQSADGYLEEITIRGRQGVTADQWLLIIYMVLSVTLLVSVLLSLNTIFSIIKSHTVQCIEKIRFVNSNAKGTPFSFFNFIFWNKDIDIQTETGQQIFQHELVHVKEKHTLDKLFVQLILIVFWCNPFFWFIRRELKLIHEFIADKKSVGERGAAALAAMILSSSYPVHFNSITNQFFQTSIKRRLAMLTKIQNVKTNYISRILALPILAITVLAFTLRTKTVNNSSIRLDKTITVVIDAGHGVNANGTHDGAKQGNVYEDDITLAIAKKIQELNANEKIRIVLTRSSNNIVDLHKRVDIAKENHADLFISLHVNAADPTQNPDLSSNQSLNKGFEIYVSGKEPVYQLQSELLGSVLQQGLNTVYSTNQYLLKRKVGVWVLDRNVCPSVLIECGFLTDDKDREFITNDNNQAAVAQKILQAIERYALNQQLPQRVITDTTPQKQQNNEINQSSENLNSKLNTQKPPLFIVEGKEISKDEAYKIDRSAVESINVLKDKPAIDKYGKKGLSGVVEIKLKEQKSTKDIIFKEDRKPFATGKIKIDPATNTFDGTFNAINDEKKDTVPKTEPLFTKVEIEAAIDKEEWRQFLQKNLQPLIVDAASKGMEPGNYTVKIRFIVKTDGTISNVEALTDPGYRIAEKIVEAMKNSPKWMPGIQNGKPVNSFHTQPVTLVIEEVKNNKNTTSKIPEIKLSDLKKMTSLNIPNLKSFTIVGELNNNDLYSYHNKGASFDNKAKILWSNLKIGSILSFENIIVSENNLEMRKPALVYRIVS